MGKALRYIPIHDVAEWLGEQSCKTLLFMHAFSGCDTTSAFLGIGKKKFFNTWRGIYENVKC